MTWTYSGNPTLSARDAVRYRVQDTDTTDQQLSDEEIAYELTNNEQDVYLTAISLCDVLSARYSRRANKTTGDLSIQWTAVAQNYRDLKASLKGEAMRHAVPIPYSGGMRESDREIDREDTDLIQPQFEVGSMDNTGNSGFTQVVPRG